VFDGVIAIVAIAVAPDKTFQLVRLLHKQQRQQRLKNHGLSLTIWRKTRKVAGWLASFSMNCGDVL